MKNSKPLLSASIILILLILSCSESDPAPSVPSLIGTWTYTGYNQKDCADPTLNNLGFVCTTCKEVWTSSTITGSGWVAYTVTYTVNGNTISFEQSTPVTGFPNSSYTGTYVLTATTLTITIDANWSGCKIVKNYTR